MKTGNLANFSVFRKEVSNWLNDTPISQFFSKKEEHFRVKLTAHKFLSFFRQIFIYYLLLLYMLLLHGFSCLFLNTRLKGFGDSVKPKSWICSRSYSSLLFTYSECFLFLYSSFVVDDELTNPISYFEIRFATKMKRTAFPKFSPRQRRLPT